MTKFLAGIQETGADEWSLNRQVNRLTGIREIPLVTENEQHFFSGHSVVFPVVCDE